MLLVLSSSPESKSCSPSYLWIFLHPLNNLSSAFPSTHAPCVSLFSFLCIIFIGDQHRTSHLACGSKYLLRCWSQNLKSKEGLLNVTDGVLQNHASSVTYSSTNPLCFEYIGWCVHLEMYGQSLKRTGHLGEAGLISFFYTFNHLGRYQRSNYHW